MHSRNRNESSKIYASTHYDLSSYEGTRNQIMWNNKFILREGKSFFPVSFLYNLGICKVDEVVSKEGIFLKSDRILNSFFSSLLLLMQVAILFLFLLSKRNSGKYLYANLHDIFVCCRCNFYEI